MKTRLHRPVLPVILPAASMFLAGCAAQGKPPPVISLDEPVAVAAQPLPDPPKPVEVVAVPEPLALPAQLKPLPEMEETRPGPEPTDEKVRVSRANEEARVAPTREGYVNAIQVWPYSDGALYQVYAAPGRVTVVSLQAGEELVTVAAGDTVRWIVGDTSSGSGDALRVNVLVKPVRSGLKTNLVITTNRRTYHLELRANPSVYMASVSWNYPQDELIALRQSRDAATRAAPVAAGMDLSSLNFRYAIEGDRPDWRPLRAFDDRTRVFIEFPESVAQGELPPLFVIGPKGEAELVNYRLSGRYMIVDRLFAQAELRLGGRKGQDKVRIVTARRGRS